MQIVEVTDFGVRSPAIRRRRPGTALQFVLYPMIHVAEPAFYDTITARLKQADLLVVQGVGRRRTGTAGSDCEAELQIARRYEARPDDLTKLTGTGRGQGVCAGTGVVGDIRALRVPV